MVVLVWGIWPMWSRWRKSAEVQPQWVLSYGAHSNLCVNQISRKRHSRTEAALPAETDQRRVFGGVGDERVGALVPMS